MGWSACGCPWRGPSGCQLLLQHPQPHPATSSALVSHLMPTLSAHCCRSIASGTMQGGVPAHVQERQQQNLRAHAKSTVRGRIGASRTQSLCLGIVRVAIWLHNIRLKLQQFGTACRFLGWTGADGTFCRDSEGNKCWPGKLGWGVALLKTLSNCS